MSASATVLQVTNEAFLKRDSAELQAIGTRPRLHAPTAEHGVAFRRTGSVRSRRLTATEPAPSAASRHQTEQMHRTPTSTLRISAASRIRCKVPGTAARSWLDTHLSRFPFNPASCPVPTEPFGKQDKFCRMFRLQQSYQSCRWRRYAVSQPSI